nr:TetR/AcrR family transcriptional regulator [candidate division Zixibacteria bacterium]
MNENLIVDLEKAGIISATFRKLSPDKKERLYETALATFGGNVFDRVSLDMIADKAGISKGSLFQYFGYKENLLGFVGEIFLDNYRIFWCKRTGSGHEIRSRERLRRFLEGPAEFREEHPVEADFLAKMLFENSRELSNDFRRRIRDTEREHLTAIIRRGARTAEIRQDIPPEIIAATVNVIMETITRYLYDARGKTKRFEKTADFKDILEKILFDGIRG